MRLVPPYAQEILGPLGVRLGARSRIQCYSEIVFKGEASKHDRPDGLILVDTGRSQWRALVEAKHGKNGLDASQIERYLELAKSWNVDAVVTVSNQFTATPRHNPVQIPAKLTRKVELFHIAWAQIRTAVQLMLEARQISDPEQELVLEELGRYLRHPSSGIEGFTQMNSGWRELASRLRAGDKLPATDASVTATASDWIEEQKDLCLKLSEEIKTPVSLKLPRAFQESQDEWRSDIAKRIVQEARLVTELTVPAAAAVIEIDIRINGRIFIASMKLAAPSDKKSTSARTNWVVRQLSKSEDDRLQIEVHWPGRRDPRRLALSAIRSDPDILKTLDDHVQCNAVSVLLVDELSGRFSGSRTFIEGIETAFIQFYREVGQHLKAWQPSAPRSKPAPKDVVEVADQETMSKETEKVAIPDHLI